MKNDYRDILDVAGPPVWWDHDGVPRYVAFAPELLGVYQRFAILARIECQSCRLRMSVGCGYDRSVIAPSMTDPGRYEVRTLTLAGLAEGFAYGDPPHHGGCGGESMQSVGVYIEQAWERSLRPGLSWSRNTDLERVDIRPDWDDWPSWGVSRGG